MALKLLFDFLATCSSGFYFKKLKGMLLFHRKMLAMRATDHASARLKAAMNRIDINGTATWLQSRS